MKKRYYFALISIVLSNSLAFSMEEEVTENDPEG